MSLVHNQRNTARKIRESLGFRTRNDFVDFLRRDRGVTLSVQTIEAYEKEIPADALRMYVSLARERGLDGLAEELLPTNQDPVNIPDENRQWHYWLELVLNDQAEALGIKKNLEWAVRTVKGKSPETKVLDPMNIGTGTSDLLQKIDKNHPNDAVVQNATSQEKPGADPAKRGTAVPAETVEGLPDRVRSDQQAVAATRRKLADTKDNLPGSGGRGKRGSKAQRSAPKRDVQ